MSNKDKLNEEQLNQVSGGAWGNDEYQKELADIYINLIDKYDTPNYIGQDLYFTHSGKNPTPSGGTRYYFDWIFGTLLDSYENSKNCGTVRTAKIQVIKSGGDTKHKGIVDISLDVWKVYCK